MFSKKHSGGTSQRDNGINQGGRVGLGNTYGNPAYQTQNSGFYDVYPKHIIRDDYEDGKLRLLENPIQYCVYFKVVKKLDKG